jgi:hypothetical protein
VTADGEDLAAWYCVGAAPVQGLVRWEWTEAARDGGPVVLLGKRKPDVDRDVVGDGRVIARDEEKVRVDDGSGPGVEEAAGSPAEVLVYGDVVVKVEEDIAARGREEAVVRDCAGRVRARAAGEDLEDPDRERHQLGRLADCGEGVVVRVVDGDDELVWRI